MKKNSIAILLLVVLAVGCSSGGGGGTITQDQLAGKTFKIANQQALSEQVSVPTTRGSSASQSIPTGGGKTISIPLPDTITFSADGTFRLTYSNTSYLQGNWRITDGRLEVTFAGRTALVDISFPDSNSITITISSSNTIEPGQTEPGQPTPAPGGTSSNTTTDPADFVTQNNLTGTWCYQSGFVQTGAGAITSLIFQTSGRTFVKPSSQPNQPAPVQDQQHPSDDYEEVIIGSGGRDSSGVVTFRIAHQSDFPPMTISNGDILADYAPFKQSRLTKISEGDAVCP